MIESLVVFVGKVRRLFCPSRGRVINDIITLYKLQAIIDGDLDELTDALMKARLAELAAERAEG